MNSSPANDIPADLVERWRALQEMRGRRAAGRCDCHCRRCTSGPGRGTRPRAATLR